jgi:hypothetical protein
MKKNDEGVTLSEKEFEVTAMRDLLFDQGDGVRSAARTALSGMSGTPSKQFVEWLSSGHLTKEDGKVVDVEPDADPDAPQQEEQKTQEDFVPAS